MIGSAISLEGIDTDFLRRVQVPTGLGEKRLDVAAIALRFTREEHIPTLRGRKIEISAGYWFGRGNR